MNATIADSFDSRALAKMEVALDLACKVLAVASSNRVHIFDPFFSATVSEQHEARRYIANKILECANGGDKTLSGLTEAGQIAASELCVIHGV